jgi:RimJ/RimL family protein N-acetyltransferase
MAAAPERESWRPEAIPGRWSSCAGTARTTCGLHALVLDPEIARLTRYQQAPLSTDEVQRFFYSRIMGSDFLAMAIHVRDTDRLIGTCAFSQLDGDNGSTLYHITIGEPTPGARATAPRPRN